MDRQTLILITEHFPCGHGEEELETELLFLCQQFHVKIITLDYDAPLTRTLPQDVTFLRLPVEDRSGKFLRMLGHVFYPIWHREIRAARRHGRKVFSHYTASLETIADAKYLADFIISQEEFSEDTPLVLYSYGLHPYTYGICQAAKKRRENLKTVLRIDTDHTPDYVPYEQAVNQYMDEIYLQNDRQRRYYMEKNDIVQNRSRYKICDIGVLAPQKQNPPQKDAGFHIISHANITENSRYFQLVDALSRLDGIQISWTHISSGKGLLTLKDYADEVFYYKPNISYHFDISPTKQDIETIYTKSHLDFYLTLEPAPEERRSIVEAMSYGVYVVGINNGFLDGLVSNENGIILPSDIDAPMLSKVLSMLQRVIPAEVEKKRQAAFQTWDRHFNAEKVYPEFARNISL